MKLKKNIIYDRIKRYKIFRKKFQCLSIYEESVKILLEDIKENLNKWKDIRFWDGKIYFKDVNCFENNL